jgi:hypothetical protein
MRTNEAGGSGEESQAERSSMKERTLIRIPGQGAISRRRFLRDLGIGTGDGAGGRERPAHVACRRPRCVLDGRGRRLRRVGRVAKRRRDAGAYPPGDPCSERLQHAALAVRAGDGPDQLVRRYQPVDGHDGSAPPRDGLLARLRCGEPDSCGAGERTQALDHAPARSGRRDPCGACESVAWIP